MNSYLLLSGVLVILLGLAHSIIGERLIFKPLRAKSATATALMILPARRWAAIWSAWHLLTLFGCGLGALLIALAWRPLPADTMTTAQAVLISTFLLSAAFWIAGTKGRHPAWIALILIALTTWLA